MKIEINLKYCDGKTTDNRIARLGNNLLEYVFNKIMNSLKFQVEAL